MWLLILLACTDPEPSVLVETNGSIAYDADNDGFADVAIFQQPDGNQPGSLELFYGGEDGLSNARQTSFSISIAGGHARWVGDINGDGYADAAVASEDFGSSPLVSIAYGGPRGSTTTTQVQCNQGDAPESESGAFVRRAGDIDGDGIDDLVVTSAGRRMCTWLGRSGPHSGDPDHFEQGNVGSNFGSPYQAMGDIDGDGFDDLAMGTDIRRGSPAGLSNDTLFLPVSPLGVADPNGDGVIDLISSRQGSFSVWMGGADGFESATEIPHAVSLDYSNRVGIEFVSLGDVTGDGNQDLGVSIPWANESSAGWVALLEGGPQGYHMDTPVGTQIPPEYSFAPTGETIDLNGFRIGLMLGLGDIDGDGIGDIGIEVYNGGLAWIRGSTGRLSSDIDGAVLVNRASPRMAVTGSGAFP
jgi:hypothetical protein